MNKKHLIRIVIRSTIALVIPAIGQLFVPGWNWGAGEFVFAWIFFNLLGIAYTAVTSAFTRKSDKIAGAILVVAVFAFVWIRLATG